MRSLFAFACAVVAACVPMSGSRNLAETDFGYTTQRDPGRDQYQYDYQIAKIVALDVCASVEPSRDRSAY